MMESSIYQFVYTAVIVLLSFFTVAMVWASIADKNYFKAVGNSVIATFCIFACLVRFGLIS
ncbi:hypothetical protein [Reinekea sp. G2M2-21]|uniref:hypothetical protein n=1 Tax=Reinekea sp. G2M2-21 TaxID=2788942 RepID=UPI0018AA5728|nr:hypothetical protein [Reinekea sp. G2M2-21]